MIRSVFCLLTASFAGLVYNLSYAQQPTLDKTAPASPEIAQFNKYINTPISPSTGTVSIDVPLYTIKTPNFQWPVSLSYHASGIRVDEISSCVGLGWQLNATGVVSRAIMGQPDEIPGGFGSSGNTLPYTTTDYYQLASSQREDVIQFIMAGADNQPDIFSFSVNGRNGSFNLHRTKGVMLQSESNVRIALSGYPVIIDETGNTYYFTAYESGTARNYMYMNATVSGINEIYDGITAWYLTKVVSHDLTDTIEFVYNGAYNIRQEQDQYSFKIGQDFTPQGNTCQTGLQIPIVEKTHNQVTSTSTPLLTEIKFKTGKIVFNYIHDRLDMETGATPTGNQGRLSSVSIFAKENQTYTLFQKDSLFQSYFTSTVPSGKNPGFGYRLKFDSVSVFDKNNVVMSNVYKFEYSPTLLPYRTSHAQDFWGFYNGADTNTTLTPNRIIDWVENGSSIVYNIGTAIRTPNSAKMQACMLNKITYPTGGYTIFEFEPHKYYDDNLYTSINPPVTTPVTHTLTATPGTPTHNPKLRFTHDGPSQQITVSGFFKAFYGKSDNPPYAKIKKVESAGFSNILTIVSSDENADKYEDASYNLIGGAKYELEAYVHAGSYPVNEVWSTVTLTRNKVTTGEGSSITGGTRIIGGLRIKSKTDYLKAASVDSIASKEIYTYGSEGEGILITHPGILNRDYMNVYDRAQYSSTYTCVMCQPYHYRQYGDQSPYAASTLSGALVGYANVEKKQIDRFGNTLGKHVYQYQILTDDFGVYDDTDNYYPLSKKWQNGKLLKEEIYSTESDGNLLLIQSKSYDYSFYKKDTVYNLIVLKHTTAPCIPSLVSNFIIYQGRKYLGKKLPSQVITTKQTRYADNSVGTMIDTVQFTYSGTSAHQNPILIEQKSSGKKVLEEYNYFPEDMITELGDHGGGIYDSMVQKGLTGLQVLNRQKNNGVQTQETRVEYSMPYETFIKPYASYMKKGTYNAELIQSMKYFENGALKEQSLNNNFPYSYQFGYNSVFPVVQVINARDIPVTYNDQSSSTTLTVPTGLNEATATLITYEGTTTLNLDAHPGKTYELEYSLVGPVVRSGTLCVSSSSTPCQSNHYASSTLNGLPAGTYILSLFYYGSDPDVFRRVSYTYPRRQIATPRIKEFFYDGFEDNPSPTVVRGIAHSGSKYWNGNYTTDFAKLNSRRYILQWWNLSGGKWIFNQQPFTANITLTGPVDDVRIFPSDAQMTSYTYMPLIGVTSKTDPSGKTVTYEYDSFGRLQTIRDQDKKVLKNICYNYAGQPENCTIYGNVAKSGTFIKTCTGCQTGTSVIYTVPKDTYTASIQTAADQLAQNDVNANGQAYANANGSCSAPVTGILKGTNQISLKNFTISLVNINPSCGTTPYIYTLNGGAANVSLGSLPSGNYNITVTPVGGNVFYTCTINGMSLDGSSSVSFLSQPVSNGTLITITPVL